MVSLCSLIRLIGVCADHDQPEFLCSRSDPRFLGVHVHGREPDGVTSCYPIPQDGGANRTKVGQSIFSI